MRILLAEDERSLSRAVVALLERSNYSVDAVYNGQDALDYLEGQEYDGAILDVMMPKMDGLTVLSKIREQGNHVPVLLLTAKTQVDDRVLGLDAGADDYLGKPFAMKELLARIRAITRRQSVVSANTLSYGNVTLDRTSYELSVGSERIRLANKDFQMMEMLLTNPGQVISTERFMEKVWGYDSDTEINVVWVYLSHLRKKLALMHADIAIKSIRNLGYSLEKVE